MRKANKEEGAEVKETGDDNALVEDQVDVAASAATLDPAVAPVGGKVTEDAVVADFDPAPAVHFPSMTSGERSLSRKSRNSGTHDVVASFPRAIRFFGPHWNGHAARTGSYLGAR